MRTKKNNKNPFVSTIKLRCFVTPLNVVHRSKCKVNLKQAGTADRFVSQMLSDRFIRD